MRRTMVLIAVVTLAAGMAACGSDSSADPATTGATSADTAASTAPPATDPPVTTTAPTTTPPTTAAPTTAAPTTAAPTTAAPTTAPPTTLPALPPFPPALAELPNPPDVWSVVLAGSADIDDPVLTQAQAAAADAGYDVGVTDCDEGAAEAIGMAGSGVYTITVYLNSEADAHAAADAFAARGIPATVAQITLFCLD